MGLSPQDFKRSVMGRKGIGKLSLFSIARTVEVHSVKQGKRHGFRMNLDDIEKAISDGENNEYSPDPVDPARVEIEKGTKIFLTDMKRQLHRSSSALRRRLARRFSIIGANHNFQIELDRTPITIEDRDYYDKLQYMWTFGARGERLGLLQVIWSTTSHAQGKSK